ncbi:LuxR C-terminal-related transcriptional regulator [Thermomonas flagellata]|uniref:LuxR C-terminal-related transcriptional regulator n=1 Tax=Thermomonas flagellata TaxID=2888524 RepID=UPI001F04A44C|nr:response regulator transcription factor [Thermomonas flagellata]
MSAPLFRRALVVDDQPEARAWLEAAVAVAFPEVAVASAGSLGEAMAQLDPAPELALVDLGLPDGSGVALIAALAQRAPACVCVVATVFDDDAHLFPALRAGAQGYVLKDHDRTALAAMLRGIAAGQPPLSASIARRLLRHFQPAAAPQEVPLTARETEVLRLVAKGMTAAEVAQALGLSRHTVADYLKEIYRKLAVGSRAEATLEAARRGLVSP